MANRFCADPCCGKLLVQRDDEKIYNFNVRKYCNSRCSGQHIADKRSTNKKKSFRPKNNFTKPIPFD